MPKVKVNGIEMYYEKYGYGEPLVMITGLGGTTKSWRLQVPEFAKKYEVVIFDNRGCGQTDKPDTKYSIKLLADDTANLMTALNIQEAHILGISMGGWIAQHLAIYHPHLTKKLVLSCTSDKVYKMGEKIIEMWKILVQKSEIEALVKDFLIWTFSIDYFEKHQNELKQLEISLTSANRPLMSSNLLEACLEHTVSYDLSKILAPTLVIAGDQDILYPARISKLLAERISNAKLSIFENCGHAVIWEQPEKFNKIILDFLSGS